MTQERTNYSMEIYMQLCEKMIESIVSNLDYREFEKHLNLQYEDRWKKTQMKNYCEQLKAFVREQLKRKFIQVSADYGLEMHLKEVFIQKQQIAILETLLSRAGSVCRQKRDFPTI